MIFGYFILFVALIISAVAEYYSIMGLTSIFASAYWSVVIMGVALGIGKITAAVWLKLNWSRASWTYKMYLVPAVAFLMFLTSMGIFGFLSKAHSDLSLETNNISAQIAVFDEKIKVANDNIDANKKVLRQLDDAVDQVLSRSTSEQGAIRSVKIRKSQQKERKELIDNIAAEQEIINQLTQERSKIAAEIRKVEAEVGPIKYIAALIYGNNPDTALLESAVRWVIILIVLVFDPLALCLILAAQQSIRWAKEEKKNQIVVANLVEKELVKEEKIVDVGKPIENNIATSQPLPEKQQDTNKNVETLTVELPESLEKIDEPEPTKLPEKLDEQDSNLLPAILPAEEINKNLSDQSNKIIENNTDDIFTGEQFVNAMIKISVPVKQNKIETKLEETETDTILSGTDIVQELAPAKEQYTLPPPPPEAVAPKAKEIIQVPETLDRNNMPLADLKPTADNDEIPVGTNVKAHFGITFPVKPAKGELFLRVDYLPSRLFKFNGSKWIEVDKSMTDSYVYNTEYIKFMIKEIDAGRLDPDDLSSSEREQIADFLANDEQTRNPS